MLLCTIAAGAFFPVKMTIHGFDKPCGCLQLAAGAFFSAKMVTRGFDKPCGCLQLAAGAFFSAKMATHGFDKPCGAENFAAGVFFRRKWPPGLRRTGVARLIAWKFQTISGALGHATPDKLVFVSASTRL